MKNKIKCNIQNVYKNNIIVIYILQILGWKWMNEVELILKNNCNNCISICDMDIADIALNI